MRKLASIMLVLAAWPLLTAGGGMNPPPPGLKLTGPALSATFVMDPSTGQSSMRLQKGSSAVSSAWVMNSDGLTFFFSRGCLTSQADMDLRFKYAFLTDLQVPNGGVDILQDLGITVTGSNRPMLTDVNEGSCSPVSAGTSGVLSFTGVVQFLVPSSRNN